MIVRYRSDFRPFVVNARQRVPGQQLQIALYAHIPSRIIQQRIKYVVNRYPLKLMRGRRRSAVIVHRRQIQFVSQCARLKWHSGLLQFGTTVLCCCTNFNVRCALCTCQLPMANEKN